MVEMTPQNIAIIVLAIAVVGLVAYIFYKQNGSMLYSSSCSWCPSGYVSCSGADEGKCYFKQPCRYPSKLDPKKDLCVIDYGPQD